MHCTMLKTPWQAVGRVHSQPVNLFYSNVNTSPSLAARVSTLIMNW